MGNASELEGGAFGRAAAAFFSIESQKSSALHVHGHVVIEGLHQYNILQETGNEVCGERRRIGEALLGLQSACLQTGACKA